MSDDEIRYCPDCGSEEVSARGVRWHCGNCGADFDTPKVDEDAVTDRKPMRFGYVTVIEAPNEERARAYLNAQLRTYGPQSPAIFTGGGASISDGSRYVTGVVAAAIAQDAYDDEENKCERLSKRLHAAAILDDVFDPEEDGR